MLAALLLLGAPAYGAEHPKPDPSLAPERVVEIQLRALQRNDHPSSDAGIARAWAFAHPDNKRVTGPLERFAAMIKSPMYRMLLGHREHTIERVAAGENSVVFAVTVVPASGPVVVYRWTVARVRSGPLAGAWMTVSVSPPMVRGESI